MTGEGAPQNEQFPRDIPGYPGEPGSPGEAPGQGKSPGQIDNPDINRKYAARQAEKAQIQAESLSIAQRLSRRSKTETIFIPFTDDLGEFFVEVRLPTTAEMDILLKFDRLVTGPGAGGDLEGVTDQVCGMLAELAVDESLDKDYFKDGNFLISDLSQIIKEIMLETEKRITQVKSFRKDAVRTGSLSIMSGPGEVSKRV